MHRIAAYKYQILKVNLADPGSLTPTQGLEQLRAQLMIADPGSVTPTQGLEQLRAQLMIADPGSVTPTQGLEQLRAQLMILQLFASKVSPQRR